MPDYIFGDPDSNLPPGMTNDDPHIMGDEDEEDEDGDDE